MFSVTGISCYNGKKGGKLSKNTKQNQFLIGAAFAIVAIILIIVVLVNMMGKDTTGDVKIGGEAKVVGLVCKDTELIHPALESKPMLSHTNTITANFLDDKLSSISLVYEGEYGTDAMAKEASDFAKADYNLTLTNKYGEKNDIFSNGFSINGAKVQMVQTARDISKINNNTITYFLLDQGTSLAKTLDGMKKQYEAKGFTCEISE